MFYCAYCTRSYKKLLPIGIFLASAGDVLSLYIPTTSMMHGTGSRFQYRVCGKPVTMDGHGVHLVTVSGREGCGNKNADSD